MKSMTSFSLLVLTILSLILGVSLGSWVFLVVTIASFSILAIGNRGVIKGEVKLEVERKSEEKSVYEGDKVWIELSIENKGRALNYLEVYDSLPENTQIVEGSNHQLLRLDKGEEKTISYKITCPQRGEMEIGPVKLRYRDPLNFHVEEWTSQKLMKLFVLPKIEKLKKVNVRPLYTREWIGNIKSQTMGMGTEFFSIREYTAEDDLGKINWKATSRFLEPMSNEYVGERSGDVIIIVDGHRFSNIGTFEENTLNATIRAAGSLANSILMDRNRVGLIILGDFLSWVYPDSGRDHYYKILEKLSGVEEGGMWKLKDTKWLLKRFFPNRSMIIFISPLLSETVSEIIVDICEKEYNVMVISPNPLTIQKELVDTHNPLAEEITQLERDIKLERLWKYSMVVDWSPNEPLEASLQEVIRYWKRN